MDHVNTPEWATAVGLLMYAHRHYAQQNRAGSGSAFARAFVRLRGMFHELPGVTVRSADDSRTTEGPS